MSVSYENPLILAKSDLNTMYYSCWTKLCIVYICFKKLYYIIKLFQSSSVIFCILSYSETVCFHVFQCVTDRIIWCIVTLLLYYNTPLSSANLCA